MKLRKCFKTVLSAVLAAAMLVTAAPANSVMAAQIIEEATETTVVTEGAEVSQTSVSGDTQTLEAQQTTEESKTEENTEEQKTTEQTTEQVEANSTEAVASPVIDGKSVTFNYQAESTISTPYLAGSMNSWSNAADPMTYDETAGCWTITKTFAPGTYEYKFVLDDGSNLITDPLNTRTQNTNSAFSVAGLMDTETSAVLGTSTELAESLDACTSEGGTEAKAVAYSLTAESQAYSDKITIGTNAEGKPIVTLAQELAVTEFTLTATDTSDAENTCTVTVKVLSKTYEEDENLVSPVAGKGEATFYYFAPTASLVQIKGEMTGSSWPTVDMNFDEETGYWYITLTMAVGSYQYGFMVDGAWSTDPLNPLTSGSNSVVTITEAASEKSPVIEGKNVTFLYKDAAGTAEKVSVAGTMNGWTVNQNMMEKNEESGYWELTMENMAAGEYQYKIVVGDNGWTTDPLNSNELKDGNSVFWVGGLVDAKAEATRDGKQVELPSTLSLYGEDGTKTEAAVTYSLSAETSKAAYANKITLATDAETGAPTVSVAEDFPAETASFTLTATEAGGNTATVTVSVVDAKYTYTIYYYDKDHNAVDSAALWIWETDGAGATDPMYFTEAVELEDGRTWLKADVELSYTNVSIIPRAYDSWAWQDTTRTYSNTEKVEATTLYIVNGDGANIYNELPEVVELEDRYLIVEYTRTDAIDGWYLYTWNSGYGSDVWEPFEAVAGSSTTGIAKVKLKHGLSSLSYCIVKMGPDEAEPWAGSEKDGNDYLCPVPADQIAVKICMEEGKGITHTYPYNKGYEIVPTENKIQFYYRNDEAFTAGSEGGFASVQIEIDGTAHTMNYDSDAQRYTYSMADLEDGEYKYRYILKEEAGSTPEYVLDKFNAEKVTENDVEYSVCKYEKFEADVAAVFANASMDYNDNNVLSVSFKGKDGEEVPGMEATSATADLTALGGGITEIVPELLALTVAVKEGIPAGEKSIPVTVYDQYNNEYKTTATVNVVDRNKGGDFDWDEAVIYFAVTDRFFDGNTKNNGKGYNKSETGSSSYHGGDFAGLTKKLDYLQDLGVNTIWITPIVENKMDAGLTTDVTDVLSWGYHGYWASNFTKLDSHLGTEKEFKALLDAAHKRGMKIMVDVVLNHSGYEQEDYFNNILKDEEGNSIPMIRSSEQMVNGSDQMSSLSGLPDFLTENAEVRELLVEWQSSWISKYDIDYYRVDTVKHVDDATWSAFKNALTEINPDFKMIGEWAGAGYATDTGMLGEGRMDSLLDFDFNDQALNFVTGNIEATENFLAARNAAIDNTATLGAFLGSHDEDGFVLRMINERNVPAEKSTALAKVAASLQMTTKGQIVIYYGEEIGMTGANNYPYQENRYDFDWTQANDKNEMLQHYKRLLSIREQYSEVLAKGTRSVLLADDAQGLDVFARSYNGETVYTGLNLTDTAAEYTLTGQTPNTFVMDIYGDKLYRVDGDGNVTVSIPAAADGGTAILVESIYENPFHVTCIGEKTYTGKAITLTADELEVYYGATKLTAGTDYKVSYKNNKEVGTATVTVTGTGNYTGKDTVTFAVVPKNLADEDVVINYSAELIEAKKAQKPLSTITYNGAKLKAAEYSVEYFAVDEEGNVAEKAGEVKAAGAYKMVITGKYDAAKNKGSYTGRVEKDITVYPNDKYVYLKDMIITMNGNTSYSTGYTGTEIKPTIVVTPKGKNQTAISVENYTVSYADNVDIGTATITITGKSEKGLVGTVTKTFGITGTALKNVAKVNDTAKIDGALIWQKTVPYDVTTGMAVQPVDENGKNLVTLTYKSNKYKDLTFVEGVDYEVSYLKNDKPGKATMVFTGIGKYTGTVTKTFSVGKIALDEKDAKLVVTTGTEATYTKKGGKVDVAVCYDGVTLVEGKDYKVSYKNNTAVTTEKTKENKKPTVTITGLGSFSGSITRKFVVNQADLATDVQISVADAAYQNKKGKYMVVPVLTDTEGTKLADNKDFTCTYYLVDGVEETLLTKTDVVDAGETVKVVVTAKAANFKGSTSAEYEIKVQDISKASVSVNAQVYTGKEITITDADFSKIKVGDTTLKLGKHYEILDDYQNNINKGTASVTIKGIGNYGGTKKVTFKITSRTMAWWWNLVH